MSFLFQPEPIIAVPIQGSQQLYPVRRIYCVGQNYSDHVREMGGDPKQTPPVFFSKPANAIVINNQQVHYPPATKNLHYEVELVVALGSGGLDLNQNDVQACVFGYGVGIDFTRRDLQLAAKQGGKPWDVAKGFDESAPLSALIPAVGIDCSRGHIWLSVNGEIRQDADLSEMIWSVSDIVVHLSTLFALKAGDLIFTGTPAGVSAVSAGDQIKAGIAEVGEIEFELVAPRSC
ncbi:MAG: fumarylacetoacetate hydrolase family protein [Gammaproteobacteria bacterium]|nr:fumarylacetoacetate hydrolase family protein [Gammaproteobacteria bacterium]MCY4357512.1 fumarylacetoacetate hydrolase family protein [Gammaproteobacteria bacterium]